MAIETKSVDKFNLVSKFKLDYTINCYDGLNMDTLGGGGNNKEIHETLTIIFMRVSACTFQCAQFW